MGAIALGLLCLCSCSDDDDGLDMSKSITVYGRQYELANVIAWQSNPYVMRSTIPYIFEDTYENEAGEMVTDEVEGFTEGPDTKEFGNFMLSLYEQGMEFNESLSGITGKGVTLCCHLVSAEKDRLVPGKYVYSADRAKNTFIAYFSSEYNPEKSVTPAEICEGEINVEESGDGYTVTFNCKNRSGGEISGTYQGMIRQVKVNQQAAASYGDMKISGLMRYVHTSFSGIIGSWESDILDIRNGSAFFSTSVGDSRVAAVSGKESVDIALIWDRDDNYFRFESPIRMRTMLGHDNTYNFPCHTIYMRAPDSFTDEDFNQLDEVGFDFEVEEETIIFGTQPFKGGYVFFKTGNGIKGVIGVRDFTPMGSKTSSSLFGTEISEVNPQLVVDVKCESSFNNPIMR